MTRNRKCPPSDEEISKLNRIQSDFFSGLIEVFDPPLPEGVWERLERIVASAKIQENESVLDVGAGTGILVPIIHRFRPEAIFACDLSQAMLDHLEERYPFVRVLVGDVRDVTLADESIDVVFMNACYPNVVDKEGSMKNIVRMMRTGGRLVISHPMGKSFIERLKDRSPFPLDEFPERPQAAAIFARHGLTIQQFIDEPGLYLLVATKENSIEK